MEAAIGNVVVSSSTRTLSCYTIDWRLAARMYRPLALAFQFRQTRGGCLSVETAYLEGTTLGKRTNHDNRRARWLGSVLVLLDQQPHSCLCHVFGIGVDS
jgi:hypothetical protein